MPSSDSYLNLAFSSDANYFIGLETAFATSIIASHQGTKIFNIYIDGVNLTEQQITSLNSLSDDLEKKYHVTIYIKWLELNVHLLKKVQGLKDSRTFYTRLILPELIPDQDWVIWVDADMIIRKDLKEVMPFLTKRSPLAAVADPFILTLAHEAHDLNAREILNTKKFDLTSRYYCAGFFPADLNIWRKEGLTDKLLEWLLMHQDTCTHRDQSAINWNLADRVTPLPEVYSYLTSLPQLRAKDYRKPVNLHFTGMHKPWEIEIDWNTRYFIRDFQLLFSCFEFYATRVELMGRYDIDLLKRFLHIAKTGRQFLANRNTVFRYRMKVAVRWISGNKRIMLRWQELIKFYKKEAPSISQRLDEIITETEKFVQKSSEHS